MEFYAHRPGKEAKLESECDVMFAWQWARIPLNRAMELLRVDSQDQFVRKVRRHTKGHRVRAVDDVFYSVRA